MNKYIDLHTHSTCSDGSLTPSELVKKTAETGLAAIALTDHDTVDGLYEAFEAGKKYGVEVISGIEFSLKTDREVHMLGLNFTPECPSIRNELEQMKINRQKRNREVLRKLNELNINITDEDVAAQSTSDIVGRSQIAKAMKLKGYVSSVQEAFDKYLSFGKPAFVKRETLSPEKTISIIKESGGKAFLAHLNQIGLPDKELFDFLKELKSYGLYGIEGYYSDYTEEMNKKYRKMAEELDLKLSGGSDFHGSNKDNYNLGTGHGNLKIPYSLLNYIR